MDRYPYLIVCTETRGVRSAVDLRRQAGQIMRIPNAVFVMTIVPSSLVALAQAPADAGPKPQPASSARPAESALPAASAQPPAPPPPSEVLKPSLEELQQTVGAVRLEKWKRGTVRDEAGTNINAIQRDLEETLPGLLKEADAAPATISKVLPVSRNVDALYNVLVHVVEGARVAAPGDQVGQLQQAMHDLEKARVTLDNHLQDTAVAQEKQVTELRSTVAAQEKSLHAAAAAPPPAPACPAQTPAKKKRPAKKPATPATSTNTPATSTTPASGTTTKPQ